MRGLKSPMKQKEVRSVILANKFTLMGVIETKVRLENIYNNSTSPFARIFLRWDSSVFEVSTISNW